jgi:hypothetical protein
MSTAEPKYVFENGIMKLNPKYGPALPAVPVPAEPKYIFENGIMKLNPKHVSVPGVAPQSLPNALATPQTTSDVFDGNEAYKKATGKNMPVPETFMQSVTIIQDDYYLDQFNSATNLDGAKIIDELCTIFAKYEIPIGLMNKLLVLHQYVLHFLIDDSGSMWGDSDVPLREATEHILKQLPEVRDASVMMTRWQEAENRLHIFIDFIAFIPVKGIKVTFLNDEAELNFHHEPGRTPSEFRNYMHNQVIQAFSNGPDGLTPTYAALSKAFDAAIVSPHPVSIYFFTDGVPSDESTEEVCNLVVERLNPEKCPITFITCTNETSEAQWMKDVRISFLVQ